MTKKTREISNEEWFSESSLNTAERSLRHFYPTNTVELAEAVLKAAAPHLEGVKRGTVRKPVILPDQALEAAAKALYLRDSTNAWDSVDSRLRGVYREDARVVLDAVALHLQQK
jgi:hypothetical protein